MALSIENPVAEELAREVAAASGETVTQAVIHALEERLERLQRSNPPSSSPDLVERILAIAARCSSLPDLDRRRPDEILGYDEIGAFGA